jgi:hypothetical protein
VGREEMHESCRRAQGAHHLRMSECSRRARLRFGQEDAYSPDTSLSRDSNARRGLVCEVIVSRKLPGSGTKGRKADGHGGEDSEEDKECDA